MMTPRDVLAVISKVTRGNDMENKHQKDININKQVFSYFSPKRLLYRRIGGCEGLVSRVPIMQIGLFLFVVFAFVFVFVFVATAASKTFVDFERICFHSQKILRKLTKMEQVVDEVKETDQQSFR